MLILFDLDGTLTNPYDGISAGIRHAFQSLGVSVPSEAVLRSMIGPPFQESFPAHGIAAHQLDDAIAAYRDVYDHGGKLLDATVYDGVEHALDALLGQGHQLALATSKPEGPATRIVEHFGFSHRLSFIGAATADGTRRHKGDVIGHVLHHTGATNDATVMIGDRDVDVLGARQHGLRAIGVRWGFSHEGELDALQPDAIAEHPLDLPLIVERFAAA
jgi:phosphoglycolate phosphatase